MKLHLATAAILGAFALAAAAPANAAPVGDGTVSTSNLFNPTINLASNPNTYSITTGNTFEVSGTGTFAGLANTMGKDSGTLSFSSTIGTVIAQSVANFFVFDDAKGGTYNFSVTSVQTTALSNQPGTSTGITLFVLGTTTDSHLNQNDPTPTSLTIQANSTGPSSYASSQTLAIPPFPVPEPMSLALLGSGLLGMGLIRRRA